MRKITIGIFTLLTVLLFYLSTVTTVTALIRENHIDMKSTVGPTYPGYTMQFIVNVAPTSGRWTVRVPLGGDDFILQSRCYWENNYDPAQVSTSYKSGYHYFRIIAYYDSTDYSGDPVIKETYSGESGSDWAESTQCSVMPNTSMYVCYYMYVKNYITDTEDEDVYIGYIDFII